MVVVSIALCKHRIPNIESIIKDFFNGIVKPDKIHFFISKEPFYLDEGIKPKDIAHIKHSKVEFHYVRNIGSLRKWIPVLRMYRNNPNQQILICDDDRHFPPDFLKRCVEFQNRHPNVAVGGGGYHLNDGLHIKIANGWSLQKPQEVSCLVPCVGILIKQRFFTERDTTKWKRYMNFRVDLPAKKQKNVQIDPRVSDEVFGNYLMAKNGIKRFVVNYSSCPLQMNERGKAMTSPNTYNTTYSRIAQRQLFYDVLTK